jgi:hypothetical protein
MLGNELLLMKQKKPLPPQDGPVPKENDTPASQKGKFDLEELKSRLFSFLGKKKAGSDSDTGDSKKEARKMEPEDNQSGNQQATIKRGLSNKRFLVLSGVFLFFVLLALRAQHNSTAKAEKISGPSSARAGIPHGQQGSKGDGQAASTIGISLNTEQNSKPANPKGEQMVIAKRQLMTFLMNKKILPDIFGPSPSVNIGGITYESGKHFEGNFKIGKIKYVQQSPGKFEGIVAVIPFIEDKTGKVVKTKTLPLSLRYDSTYYDEGLQFTERDTKSKSRIIFPGQNLAPGIRLEKITYMNKGQSYTLLLNGKDKAVVNVPYDKVQ